MTQVTVFANDVLKLNDRYIQIFTETPGFSKPIFSGIQYPTVESGWLHHLEQYMGRSQALEIYNHYLVWLKCLDTQQPQVIIYNRTSPVQNNEVTGQLILAPVSILDDTNTDIVFYGKHSDRCDLYRKAVDVNVMVDEQSKTFTLYRTVSPYGGYAYLITPSGANKLVKAIVKLPMPLQAMLKLLCEDGVLNALTYNPSVVLLLSDPNENNALNSTPLTQDECRNSNQQPSNYGWHIFGAVLIVLILALIIAAIIYFLVITLNYRPPPAVVYTNNVQYEMYENMILGSRLKPISYGPIPVVYSGLNLDYH
jgi:hypothetical protein